MKSVLISLKETKYQILLVTLITFGVYFNSLFNTFVWDDHLFVEQWPAIRSFDNLGEVLRGSAPPAQGKIYRPVRGLIYMIDWQMFGMNPLGYRVQAVLLHIGVTILIYLITSLLIRSYLLSIRTNSSRIITNRQSPAVLVESDSTAGLDKRILTNGRMEVWVPFLAGLLFGLHPVHTEAITFMTSAMDMTGVLFMMASFWLYLLANQVRDPVK